MRNWIFFLFLFQVSTILPAREKGQPIILNYTPADYNGDLQNWAVVQDHRGIMYFGNNQGVLEFDGRNWRTIPIKNKIVRSLAVDHLGTIYVGSNNDFGLLKAGDGGSMVYQSLRHLLPESTEFRNVMSIIPFSGGVYFQAENEIYYLKNNRIELIPVNYSYHKMFRVGERLFFRQDSVGLSELKGTRWIDRDPGRLFANSYISTILPFSDGKFLIGSRNQGIFIYDPIAETEQIKPFPAEVNNYLVRNQIYDGILGPDGNYHWGTVNGGLLSSDSQGNLINIIHDENGLISNFCSQLLIDRSKALWITSSRGISYIEVNNPVHYWDRQSGLKGRIHDITRFDQTLYATTEDGVFYLDNASDQFEKIDNIAIQSWNLLPVNLSGHSQLLVSSTDGIYEIQGKSAREIIRLRLQDINTIDAYPNRVIISAMEGIRTMEFKNDRWNDEGLFQPEKLGGIPGRSGRDQDQNLWIQFFERGNNRLARFYYDGNNYERENLKIEFYDSTQISEVYYFEQIDDKMVFLTSGGVMFYDNANNRFQSYHDFGYDQVVDSAYRLYFINQRDPSSIFFAASKLIERQRYYSERDSDNVIYGLITRNPDGNYLLDENPLIRLPEDITSIYTENEEISWFGTINGIYRIDFSKEFSRGNHHQTLIRKVSIGKRDSVIYAGAYQDSLTIYDGIHQVPSIPYNYNQLSFSFSANSYPNAAGNKFSFILEGYENEWSTWSRESITTYSGLSDGRYRFLVKSRNVYGAESEPVAYEFVVLKPWYLTLYAIAGYLLVVLFLLRLLIKWRLRSLEKENKYLEALIQERTSEIRKQNQVLAQQKQEIEKQAEDLKSFNEEILFKNSRIEKQNEEITVQRDQLSEINQQLVVQKEELEKAYQHVKLLGDIGKEITTHISLEDIAQAVYRNLNALMDAHIFGLGIYNERNNALEFRVALENQEQIPSYSDSLDDESQLSVWCFSNQKDVFIRNFDRDYEKYLSFENKHKANELTESVIYLPLSTTNKNIGVITVQSHRKNAFTRYHLNILRNIVVYINIALENAENFEKVKQHSRDLEKAYLDIQSQKLMIEAQNQELLELNNEKNHIIGIVAHDLRNPLTSSLTMLGVLKSFPDNMDEDQVKCVEVISNALNRMNDMITRILDIKAIESKSNNMKLEQVRLKRVLRQVETQFSDQIRNKNLSLEIDAEDLVGKADYQYTIQVFENLLSNAIKFSPPGKKIFVRLYQKDGRPRLEIADQGPGISKEEMKKLFLKYQTLSNKPTGGEKSTGLGLSIVKKYVEAMHGSVWCKSEPGEGSIFFVEFDHDLVIC
jgi:signal transduction histidine kinase